MNFSQFIELKFLEWQHKAGGRKTVAEFADHIGVAQTTASSYMNGKRIPDGDTLRKIAEKLGDEVYDSLGLPRPDPDLIYIQKHWPDLSPNARRETTREAFTQLKSLIDELPAYYRESPPAQVNASLRVIIEYITISREHEVEIHWKE